MSHHSDGGREAHVADGAGKQKSGCDLGLQGMLHQRQLGGAKVNGQGRAGNGEARDKRFLEDLGP
jgi:hypothetical protein